MEGEMELTKIFGKTIKDVLIKKEYKETMLEGHSECLEFIFTDGTSLLLRSQDREDWSSWLVLKFKEAD